MAEFIIRPAEKKYTDKEILAIFENPDTPVFVYDRAGDVLESARGLHIGTALFEYVKAFAKEKGCHNITLHVWEGNPGAKAFYEAKGMVPQYTSMELVCK